MRATLDAAFLALALLTSAAAGAVFALGDRLPAGIGASPALAALALLLGLSSGAFDLAGALARARFDDRAYGWLLVVKNALALLLVVGGAALFGQALPAVAGLALAAAGATLVTVHRLRRPGAGLRAASLGVARAFALYGVPLVAGGVMLQAVPLLNRSVAAAEFGLAESGQFSLAYDLGIRVFAAIGSALDVVLLQLAVRADATSRAAARVQISRNLGVVIALLVPLGAGYLAVLPSFAALAVTEAFRAPFLDYSTVIVPALVVFAVANYGLHAGFQVGRRTWPVTTAWGIALLADAVLVAVLVPRLGAVGVAYALLGAFAAGAVALAALAARLEPVRVPWRDVGGTLAASALMLAAVWPLRALPPGVATLALQVACGGALYVGAALLLDLGGARAWLRAARAARRGDAKSVPAVL